MKSIHLIIGAAILFSACNNSTESASTEKNMSKAVAIKTEAVSYGTDSTKLTGYVAYDSASTAKRPVVLIVHEWWGLNDYSKSRAKQLADSGYLAMCVDMYGDGKMGNNPAEAQALAMPLYQNPALAKSRFDAALAKIKTYPQADTTKIAAIGYCFGGAMVLNMARLGEPLNGVVSFHGNLAGVPANKDLLKAKVLACHGADDKFVLPAEVATFKKQMDSIHADYTFKEYAGATHAFTNPAATENGKKFNLPIAYNAAADTASWKDMTEFFAKIFK
ncbi:MAG: dienelactone hydrolase family protein [Bacteroidetes bacterium]|nr:dienelactone hydrolase family protein [Bacteroidota bacterium]